MKTLFVCSVGLLLSHAVVADPTRPAPGWQADVAQGTAAALPGSLQLQLIKDTAQGKTALINGQLLRKGQMVQHYRVSDITAEQVILELNGERHVLSLINTAIKQYE